MRQLGVMATCLLVLLSSACAPVKQNSSYLQDSGTRLAEARAERKANLRVLYVAADGFAYKNEAGELTGVTVEIMRDFVAWFERYHAIRVELEFIEEENWTQFYQRVVAAEGGVFGLGNVTITQPRRQELQFSPAYLNNVAVLITAAHIPELTHWHEFEANFADLQPMGFSGTLHETRIRALRDKYHADREVVLATSNPQIIDAVAAGEVYSYIDAYNYWRAIQQGKALRHHPIADEHGETFGIIMPHSNDWADMMTAFFAAYGGYRTTPRYRELLVRHLGEDLTLILENARLQAVGSAM